MSANIAEKSDNDLAFRLANTKAFSGGARRATEVQKPFTRIHNVKKQKTEDDEPSSSTLSWHDDIKQPPRLPLVLDVPVRLNNSALSVKEVSLDTNTKSYSTYARKQPLEPSPSILITETEHNNNTDDPEPEGDGEDSGEESGDSSSCESIESNDEYASEGEDTETPPPPKDNEQIEKARHKRRFVLMELLETERNYVHDIGVLVNGYMEEITKITLPDSLKGRERIVFGNVRAILAFHRDRFLPDIERQHDNPQELGALFTKYEKQLRLYVTYCENKPKSEYLVTEYLTVFQKLATRLQQRLGIQDLLIKPVQRIMKYQLLLKDILKYTENCQEPTLTLHKAMDVMHTVPKAANNMMQVGRLQDFDANLAVHGTVLIQDTLPVAEFKTRKPSARKYKSRRVFLFERIFVISDVCQSNTMGLYYKYRSSIKLSDMRLVPKVFEEPLAFVLSDTRNTKYDTYIQAPSVENKEEWVREITAMIGKHRDFLGVLTDPLASLRLSPPSVKSDRVSRSQSDRPETLLEHQKKHRKTRSKDEKPRQHRTIH